MGKKKKHHHHHDENAAGGQPAPAAPQGAPPQGQPPQGPPPQGPPPGLKLTPSRRKRAGFDESGEKGSVDSKTDLQPRLTTWDDDDMADIPMIPDLDEVQEEDLTLQVAPAPQAPVNRVATMQELNEDLEKKPAFMKLDDVDLQLLARCLQEAHDVEEPDKPWVWDVIFTEIMCQVMDEMTIDNVSADPTPQSSTTAINKKSGTAAPQTEQAAAATANQAPPAAPGPGPPAAPGPGPPAAPGPGPPAAPGPAPPPAPGPPPPAAPGPAPPAAGQA